jgi:tartrate dehydratase beta subunit/fumarate hydratase class I family protein
LGFADTLANHTAPPDKGPPCTIGKILDEMTPDDGSALTAAIGATSDAAIERALSQMYERSELRTRVGAGAVGRHRRQACKCFKS